MLFQIGSHVWISVFSNKPLKDYYLKIFWSVLVNQESKFYFPIWLEELLVFHSIWASKCPSLILKWDLDTLGNFTSCLIVCSLLQSWYCQVGKPSEPTTCMGIADFFFSNFSFISQPSRDVWKYFSSFFRSLQISFEEQGIQEAFLMAIFVFLVHQVTNV